MKYAFVILLIAHALIHLMGVAKGFGLAQLEQLSQPVSRPVGLAWLGASSLLLLVAGARFANIDEWWAMALAAVVVSQILIVAHWQDAKWGTLPNIMIFVVAWVGLGQSMFQRAVAADLRALPVIAAAPAHDLTDKDLASLPEVVRAWVRRSGAVGSGVTQSVHLRQTGRMQTAPGSRWMPFSAEQWFNVETPSFLWVADVVAVPGLHLAGKDRYINGRGNMLIELLFTFTVADESGPQIDQGSLLRYLGELVWFPGAAARPYLKWQELDQHSARATISHGGVTASGVFRFRDDGDVASFQARRYLNGALQDWLVEVNQGGYKNFGQRRLPAECRVTWKLPEGDWTWLELSVDAISMANPPTRPNNALPFTYRP